MSGALEGLRIEDFSQLVQGPNATQMLADMGADVIKIEPLQGDWQRNWSLKDAYINGEAVSFLTFNRGKRSIALNLKQPTGKEAALKIIQSSDVLLENFRPGVMDRLGLGYESLANIHPKLIYCASCGWGQDGPYVKRPGQNLLAQAVAGVLYLNGKAVALRPCWQQLAGSANSIRRSRSNGKRVVSRNLARAALRSLRSNMTWQLSTILSWGKLHEQTASYL